MRICIVLSCSQVQIIENKVMKVDEVQQPIVGGSWKTKTGFGQLEIKVTPYWTGRALGASFMMTSVLFLLLFFISSQP